MIYEYIHTRRRPAAKELHPISTICKIEYKKKHGIGAIYKLEFPRGTWRTLFITSYEVLDICNVSEITELQVKFEDHTIGNVYLTPDWVKWLWTSPQDKLNVTVIEFSTTALNILSRSKYVSLESGIPIEQSKVTVYDNTGGVLPGSIHNVIEDLIEFTIPQSGYAGAPLLNEELIAVGIYNGFWDPSNESAALRTHKATNIQSILNAFKVYITEKCGGKTENELWLERIDQIPKDELQIIGIGGFGKVFKFKENNGSVLAVKIVSALGSPTEFTYQIRALENEYRVVTRRLGNHPRIIQYFAIVPDHKNSQIMLVMEYLEGGSLADKLKDQNPLPDKKVLKYLVQILEGVSFIHRRDIYHSDIKPANILFTSEDNLKISDFGIAVGDQLPTNRSATSSYFLGDFNYMSPERMQGPPEAQRMMSGVLVRLSFTRCPVSL